MCIRESSKEEVAEGVLEYFDEDERSFALVSEMIHLEAYDMTDALAIAITYYERHEKKAEA